MRVGLVIYGDLDTVSGGYLYDRKLVEHLRAAGDTVELFSLPWRNYALRLTDNARRAWFDALSRAPLDALLQDELNHPSLFAANPRLRRRAAYPIVAIVHHLRSSEQRPAWQNAMYRRVEARYLASVDSFIFNSDTTRRAVRDALAGRKQPGARAATDAASIVARPAGDRLQPRLSPDEIADRARRAGPLRLIFVGNLIPRKGLHVLIDALAQLPRADWHLDVVGDPFADTAYAKTIRARIDSHGLAGLVTLRGAVSDSVLAGLLAASHVLAVPSFYEGFGIAYLEAMGFGLPAIGASAGAAREVISDGVDGFLVPPGLPRPLAERIAQLHHDRDLLARLGQAAQRRFLDHPTWDESMALARSHLARLVDARQPRTTAGRRPPARQPAPT